MGVAILKVIHISDYAQTWNEIYVAVVHGMDIVGLPAQAVKESRERVQVAIKNSGLPYPRKRIIVNLAPAAVRKEGPAYDLPIALGVLLMQMLVPPDSVDKSMVIGELSA